MIKLLTHLLTQSAFQPLKQPKYSIIKKQSHFCNCLKLSCLVCNQVGMVLVRRTAHSLPLRHGRSYMNNAECARLRLSFPVPYLTVPEHAPALSVPVRKTPDHWSGAFCFAYVIRLGFEPKTHSLEGCCSIQLSYRTGLYLCSIAMGAKVGAKIVFFI